MSQKKQRKTSSMFCAAFYTTYLAKLVLIDFSGVPRVLGSLQRSASMKKSGNRWPKVLNIVRVDPEKSFDMETDIVTS